MKQLVLALVAGAVLLSAAGPVSSMPFEVERDVVASAKELVGFWKMVSVRVEGESTWDEFFVWPDQAYHFCESGKLSHASVRRGTRDPDTDPIDGTSIAIAPCETPYAVEPEGVLRIRYPGWPRADLCDAEYVAAGDDVAGQLAGPYRDLKLTWRRDDGASTLIKVFRRMQDPAEGPWREVRQ